jgi:predicted MFS family arabinose efflux permease
MAQEVDKLSAGDTALRFLPMGAIGFIVSLGTGKLLEFMNGKHLLIIGLVLAVVAPISSALTSNPESGLYVSSFPFALTILTLTVGSMFSPPPLSVYHPCLLSS